MKYGFMLFGRFPTAKVHNIIYEPYSAGTIEAGFLGMATYSQDPLYPQDALNVHFNLGYIFHNDAGNKLTDSPHDTVYNTSITSEIIYGFGLRYPFEKWDLTVEFTGNAFIQKPPVTAYTRENYFYFTPGLTYKARKWLHIDLAADFRLTPDRDETQYIFGIGRLPQQLPSSHPDWRVHVGVKMAILPTSIYHVSERDILLRKAESRRRLFEQIVKEQRETEAAEEELERIKEERRKAERELERLRKLLEGEAFKTEKSTKVPSEEPKPEEPKPKNP